MTIALTHSSYANEKKNPKGSNERLEFLGDSVLSVVVSDYLYKNLESVAEGDLTKLRASLVCEKSLHVFAQQINLGKYILLGKGEENTGGRERPSILSDAFESVIAAIYLDGGLEEARKFVLSYFLGYECRFPALLVGGLSQVCTFPVVDLVGLLG